MPECPRAPPLRAAVALVFAAAVALALAAATGRLPGGLSHAAATVLSWLPALGSALQPAPLRAPPRPPRPPPPP